MPRAKLIITYEEAVKDPLSVVRKVSKHFGVRWNKARAEKALKVCTKAAINKKQPSSLYHMPKLLKKDYAEARKAFKRDRSEMIWETVLDEETKPYLEQYL